MADRIGDGPMPDDERVKRTLGAASERVLGPHVVNGILIQRSFSRRASLGATFVGRALGPPGRPKAGGGAAGTTRGLRPRGRAEGP